MLNIPEVLPVRSDYAIKAQQHWDNLIKPKGSLGRLEEVVCRICAITKNDRPNITKKRLIVFAGDHGVVEEGVSAYPQEVTQQMVRGFLSGQAAICVLARIANIELKIADAGLARPFSHPDLLAIHAGSGTNNFLNLPAMTSQQMVDAIQAGIKSAGVARFDGIDLLAGGDMGIGNTAAASAIYSSLFSLNPEFVTGKGAGLDENARLRKVEVIRKALEKWQVDPQKPLEVLRHYGGFEIACLVGLYLGAAINSIPCVVDGFICTAAAAIAIEIAPTVKEYLFFSHLSAEHGFDPVVQKLQIRPLLDLGMRLGEGTGAALAMQLIESAVHLYNEMPTFEQAEVSRKKVE